MTREDCKIGTQLYSLQKSHMNYRVNDAVSIEFSYKGLPVLFFVLLAQLDILVQFTGNRQRPYSVNLSESEFMSCVDMAKGL